MGGKGEITAENSKSAITFPKKGPVTIVTGDDCHMMRRSGARGRGPMKRRGEMIITGRSESSSVLPQLCFMSAEAKRLPITQTAYL